MGVLLISVLFVALLQICVVCTAELICRGTLKSTTPIETDVRVKSLSGCTLAASVKGNVIVERGADLLTEGVLEISGWIFGRETAVIDLGNRSDTSNTVPAERKIAVTIHGGLDIFGIDFVTIRPDVSVGTVLVESVKALTHQGVVGTVKLSAFTLFSVQGGTVTGEISHVDGTSQVIGCGAQVIGGIKYVNAGGGISFDPSDFCPPSEVSGSISVQGGSSGIIIHTERNVIDLEVSNVKNNVEVSRARLSSLNVKGLNGTLKLHSVAVDNGGTIERVTNEIEVKNIESQGDITLVANGQNTEFGMGHVVFNGGSFSGATLKVTDNKPSSDVSFIDLGDVSIVAERNDNVRVFSSSITNGLFLDNNILFFSDNTVTGKLECERTFIKGSGNSIPKSAIPSLGQCIAFVQ